jgi:hypothetical protein
LSKAVFGKETAEFIYKVIDPLISDFWGLYAVEYCDVDSPEDDMIEILIRTGVTYFRYPDRLAAQVKDALSKLDNSES